MSDNESKTAKQDHDSTTHCTTLPTLPNMFSFHYCAYISAAFNPSNNNEIFIITGSNTDLTNTEERFYVYNTSSNTVETLWKHKQNSRTTSAMYYITLIPSYNNINKKIVMFCNWAGDRITHDDEYFNKICYLDCKQTANQFYNEFQLKQCCDVKNEGMGHKSVIYKQWLFVSGGYGEPPAQNKISVYKLYDYNTQNNIDTDNETVDKSTTTGSPAPGVAVTAPATPDVRYIDEIRLNSDYGILLIMDL